MQALLSGRDGVAVLVDGERVVSLHAGASDRAVPRTLADLPHLLPGLLEATSDIRVLSTGQPEEVARELEREHDIHGALHMVSIVLDGAYSDDVRLDALDALEELLDDPMLFDRVTNLLLAAPLPHARRPAELPAFVAEANATRSRDLLDELVACQEMVQRVTLAWRSLQASIVGDEASRARLHRAAVDSGMLALGVDPLLSNSIMRPPSRRYVGFRGACASLDPNGR